jgi:hypothetical protein
MEVVAEVNRRYRISEAIEGVKGTAALTLAVTATLKAAGLTETT